MIANEKQKQIRILKEKDSYKLDSRKRNFQFSTKHRAFANDRGVTIYATCVGGANVALFKQKGENFLRLNNKLYDQNSKEDVIEYVADIDRGYEAYYKKFKK